MVKLKGPGLAAQASGQLADELVFSTWKGRPYLKTRSDPRQPQTDGQVAMRAAMRFLSTAWDALAAYAKATWQPLAAQTSVTPFNAYQGYNLTRWRSRRPPTAEYPAAETGTGSTSQNYQATGVPRGMIVEWDPLNLNDNWGYLLYGQPGSYPARTWDKLILMQIGVTFDHIKWLWRPLDPGNYYFRLDAFTVTGFHWETTHSFWGTVPA